MPARAMWIAAVVTVFLALAGVASADAPPASRAHVGAALANIKSLIRLATIWDGNKYVQCRFIPEGSLRCEAAGALMQPSLAHVLVPERVARLAALGWNIDLAFGNYVRIFASDVPMDRVADQVLQALSEAYDANLAELEVRTDWVRSEPCPPRNGPSQNLAGIINDAPAMARTALHACRYDPGSGGEPTQAIDSAAGLIKAYGPTVTGEIQRLKVNTGRRVFFALETGAGYVQCESQSGPKEEVYCEAQSAESWAVLARILTPDRVARLHAVGYADPGRAPNYSKTYPAQTADAAIADELLTILYDAYGYNGLPKLKILTEKGRY